MADRESLLRAVIEAPADDAPRLAYADAAEREGNADRAAFIRLQCELARMAGDDPRRPELRSREADLLDRQGWTWASEFGTEIDEWQFRRGFIEKVTTNLERPAPEI